MTEPEILRAAFAQLPSGQYRYHVDYSYRVDLDKSWRELLRQTQRLREPVRSRPY